MSNQDFTNKYLSADSLRENKRYSRESGDNLTLENGSAFESESESVKAKRARVSDTTDGKDSDLTVEIKDNGFLEKTVSRENDSSLEEAGSCSVGCSSTEQSDQAMVNNTEDKEEKVRMIGIDLNFPALEALTEDEEFSRENDLSLGQTGSFLGRTEEVDGEGSSSNCVSDKRYSKEEKGKGKVDDGWLSLATAWSLDLDRRNGKLWIGP